MQQITGDLFDYPVIGHGVNCKGVMGAGIAVGFKKRFPKMYSRYVDLCETKALRPGRVQPWLENGVFGFNIASQDNPGANAVFGYLVEGLWNTAKECERLNISQVHIPRIGCGIGGLQFDQLLEAVEIVEADYGYNIEFTVVSL